MIQIVGELWPQLEDHCRTCQRHGCTCGQWVRCYHHWAERLSIDPKCPDAGSWLCWDFDPGDGAVRWVCLVCDIRDDGSKPLLLGRSHCKMSTWQRHAKTTYHLNRAAAFANRSSLLTKMPTNAPRADIFRDIFGFSKRLFSQRSWLRIAERCYSWGREGRTMLVGSVPMSIGTDTIGPEGCKSCAHLA